MFAIVRVMRRLHILNCGPAAKLSILTRSARTAQTRKICSNIAAIYACNEPFVSWNIFRTRNIPTVHMHSSAGKGLTHIYMQLNYPIIEDQVSTFSGACGTPISAPMCNARAQYKHPRSQRSESQCNGRLVESHTSHLMPCSSLSSGHNKTGQLSQLNYHGVPTEH